MSDESGEAPSLADLAEVWNSEAVMDLPFRDEIVEEATQLLPTWFTRHMMTEAGAYGLLTDTGVTIGITSINSVIQAADGQLWLDVSLLVKEPSINEPVKGDALKLITAYTWRATASIATRHIVAAFELADA